jgi:hypothetical protein
MFDNKKISILLFLACFTLNCIAQSSDTTKHRSNYSLQLYVGGGVSNYFASLSPQIPGVENKKLVHPAATFRVMWQPDHLLSLGLESGYVTWYSYESNHDTVAAKIVLSSVPVLVTFSMPIAKRFRVFGGFGSYFMNSSLTDKRTMHSNTASLGWSVAAAYVQPLQKNLALAFEGKWYKAHETQDDLVSVQMQLVWRFLKW